jgi:hypothetical protein
LSGKWLLRFIFISKAVRFDSDSFMSLHFKNQRPDYLGADFDKQSFFKDEHIKNSKRPVT